MKYSLFTLLFPAILLSQNIIVKPYLQNTSTNSIVIMWELDQIEDGHVEWGEDTTLDNITIAEAENTIDFKNSI